MMKQIKSLALPFLLGLSLICACTTVFGVEHADGSFATPDGGDDSFISFKHIDNTNGLDYPYGYFIINIGICFATTQTSCVTDCTGVIELGSATLTSIPTSDIAVSSLVFNTVGTSLADATSNFCAVLDGTGNVWAIDRDLPTGSNITTANSSSRIIPCKTTDVFHPDYGCYAGTGVTDGDVTAYRWDSVHHFVIFTDNPSDSPYELGGPLGVGAFQSLQCSASLGVANVAGLVCSGTSGDPIETYTCADNLDVLNASNTAWCLFSENPRTVDGKAWAVRFVKGVIPTNDGASIVRCEGPDRFDSETGCSSLSQISIEDGFIKLDTTDGSVPFDADCSLDAHNGRMVVDDVNDLLYICTESGWISK